MTLPAQPSISADRRARLERLTRATAQNPPPTLAQAIRDDLRIDLSARYAGMPLPHPFGKASGQLSHTIAQVEADVAAGMAFIVLKTVIAEDPAGERSMAAWTQRETRMKVERRASAGGREGWTVTWKGRGWPGSLSEYVTFFRQSLDGARPGGIPVVPSVKYHLPAEEAPFRATEYRHTTGALWSAWTAHGPGGAMPIEKDFSPTLAGDDLAGQRRTILRWLSEVAPLMRRESPGALRLGLKLMNALFDDAFQVEMTRTAAASGPDFLVTFNRLFDPVRKTAFGGYDLSDRNLRVLDALRAGELLPPLSATGNICSGRMMLEYARRGAENGQVHTFFQLPLSEYLATGGSRPARALHTLFLHPAEGLVPWMWHLNERGMLEEHEGLLRFLDVAGTREARSG